MESHSSKPKDVNVDVEFQNQNDDSSKDGDGEQSFQAETPVKSTPVKATISTKQQNDNSSEFKGRWW